MNPAEMKAAFPEGPRALESRQYTHMRGETSGGRGRGYPHLRQASEYLMDAKYAAVHGRPTVTLAFAPAHIASDTLHNAGRGRARITHRTLNGARTGHIPVGPFCLWGARGVLFGGVQVLNILAHGAGEGGIERRGGKEGDVLFVRGGLDLRTRVRIS